MPFLKYGKAFAHLLTRRCRCRCVPKCPRCALPTQNEMGHCRKAGRMHACRRLLRGRAMEDIIPDGDYDNDTEGNEGNEGIVERSDDGDEGDEGEEGDEGNEGIDNIPEEDIDYEGKMEIELPVSNIYYTFSYPLGDPVDPDYLEEDDSEPLPQPPAPEAAPPPVVVPPAPLPEPPPPLPAVPPPVNPPPPPPPTQTPRVQPPTPPPPPPEEVVAARAAEAPAPAPAGNGTEDDNNSTAAAEVPAGCILLETYLVQTARGGGAEGNSTAGVNGTADVVNGTTAVMNQTAANATATAVNATAGEPGFNASASINGTFGLAVTDFNGTLYVCNSSANATAGANVTAQGNATVGANATAAANVSDADVGGAGGREDNTTVPGNGTVVAAESWEASEGPEGDSFTRNTTVKVTDADEPLAGAPAPAPTQVTTAGASSSPQGTSTVTVTTRLPYNGTSRDQFRNYVFQYLTN